LAVSAPISVLVMISSPSDFPQLDVDAEWNRINLALGNLSRRGLVSLTRLSNASLASLQQPLRQGQHHIFHFVGHSGFDEQSQDGALVLEDADGRGRLVTGQDLGVMLSGHHSLRLVVLNSCEGARGSVSDPFSGIAQSLVRQSIPAVIAMQFEISDLAAITFAQELYAAIADGYPVDTAVSESRRAIFASGNDVEWATPVLYMRSPDGRLFEVGDSASRSDVRESVSPANTAEPAVERDGNHGEEGTPRPDAGTAPPVLASDAASGSAPKRGGVRRLVALVAALVVLAAGGLVVANLASSGAGHSQGTLGTPSGSTLGKLPQGTLGSTVPTTSPSEQTTRAGDVLSQGTASLSDPTEGFDLLAGRPAFVTDSSMALLGSQLYIFDESTLGAFNLGRVPFDNIGIAKLRTLRYGRGSANPPLDLSDIPAGYVLAIHVAAQAYAKVEILGLDNTGALRFRWVTYGATSS
jgi:hypothetical protein